MGVLNIMNISPEFPRPLMKRVLQNPLIEGVSRRMTVDNDDCYLPTVTMRT